MERQLSSAFVAFMQEVNFATKHTSKLGRNNNIVG